MTEPAPRPEPRPDSSPATPPRRASDDDRERIVALLQEAMTDGRLDTSEFEERVEAGYAARTHAELDRLVADLGDEPVRPESKDRVVLRAKHSSLRRDGRWQVPRTLAVEAQSGSAVIDLTDAVLPGRSIAVELTMSSSSIRLQLPPGTEVDADDLDLIGSSWSPRTTPVPDPPLRIRVTGTLRHSSGVVTDRRSRFSRWLRRRAERRRTGRPST